jgi:glyoxylase-like metal-dependent hydrolase (beta-lactamase superfamily II)
LRTLLWVAVALSALGLSGAAAAPHYEVYAVRFASTHYPLSSLVAGAGRGTQVDLTFTIWPIRDPGSGRVILFDAGFYRDKFIQQWKPENYVRPSEAVQEALDVKPEDVTDIIVSHSHWDHLDGVDLFPKAVIWIQREEYNYYVGPHGEVLHPNGVDPDDALMLTKLKADGRVRLVDGDDQEVIPGIRVYIGGKHTYQSQFISVETRSGRVVLASDNAYLFENLDKHLAIAQTATKSPQDVESNLAAQDRMLKLAARPGLVIPGHDPAVFERFPLIKTGVVRID